MSVPVLFSRESVSVATEERGKRKRKRKRDGGRAAHH
jgi:hypothetical protein